MDTNESKKTIKEYLEYNNRSGFEIIKKLVEISYLTKNIELVYEICLQVNEKIKKTIDSSINDQNKLKIIVEQFGYDLRVIEKMSNEELIHCYKYEITRYCELIMKKIIWRVQDLFSEFIDNELLKQIVNLLSQSENINCRLYSCSVFDNYLEFLNDPNERIRKVANIRKEFDETYSSYSEAEQLIIDNLKIAYENKQIKIFDGDVLIVGKDDKILASFTDSKFHFLSDWLEFDKDVFYNIKDEKVLMYEIYKLIKEGKIKFPIDNNLRFTRDDGVSEEAKTLKK